MKLRARVVLRGDERGAIEGLPLQLLIAVIVAGVALAIILGWVLSIQTPNVISRVETTPSTVTVTGFSMSEDATRSVTVVVRAFNQQGNAIPGIVVSLEGEGTEVARARTDPADGATDGTVTFQNFQVRVPAGELTATIDVTVEASGFPTATAEILVVRQ